MRLVLAAFVLALRLELLRAEATHLLHHSAHFHELLDQARDLGGVDPGPTGDALAARRVDHIGLGAFSRGHRVDDALDARELLVFDLDVLQLLRHAGHHGEQLVERTHLLDLLHLLEEVIEGELPLEHLCGRRLGLVFLVDLLGLLDEGEHVAHTENAVREAVRVEQLEIGELLARRGERYGLADDLLDRQRRATASVAVELGQDDAVETQRGVEVLGDGDRVLAGHRIDDQERVVRVHGSRDVAHLLHQLGVDREASRSVDDDHVATLRPGLVEPMARDGYRVARLAEHWHIDLCAEDTELFDSGRALEVGPDEQRIAAELLEVARELHRVRGLARALQAGQEHDRGRLRRERDLQGFATEALGELLVDDLDDLLRGVQGLGDLDTDGALTDTTDEVADNGEVDVGLEEGEADLTQHLVDVGGREGHPFAEPGEDAVETVGE